MWMLQGIPSRKKICITIVSVVPTVAACGKASLMFNSPYCRDHGERPIGSGGRPTDIRERTDDSSERRHAIVLGLAPRSTAQKLRVLNKENTLRRTEEGGRIICHRTDQWLKTRTMEKGL